MKKNKSILTSKTVNSSRRKGVSDAQLVFKSLLNIGFQEEQVKEAISLYVSNRNSENEVSA